MLATIFIVSVAAAFWLLYRFRLVIFILFIAIMVGTATRPAVHWLSQRGIARVVGQIMIYLLVLVVVIGFLLLAVPLILNQSTAIVDLFSDYYQSFREFMLLSPSHLLQRLGLRLPFQLPVETLIPETPPPVPAEEGAVSDTAGTVVQLFGYIGLAARVIFSIVAVLLMAFYWTLEGDRAIRTVLFLFPTERRDSVRSFIEEIQARLGGFLLGEVSLATIVGMLALVAYLIIGLPYALSLALIAGVMEVVPVVGPLLGAIPAVLVAASTDPSKVIWIIVATGVIQFIENYFLVPRIMRHSVGVNPLLTLLALAALSSLLGLPGALLAIPFAALIQLVARRLIFTTEAGDARQPEGRDYLSKLRYQAQEIAQDVRKQVRIKEDDRETGAPVDQIEDAVEALASDLDHILWQASQAEGNIR